MFKVLLASLALNTTHPAPACITPTEFEVVLSEYSANHPNIRRFDSRHETEAKFFMDRLSRASNIPPLGDVVRVTLLHDLDNGVVRIVTHERFDNKVLTCHQILIPFKVLKRIFGYQK